MRFVPKFCGPVLQIAFGLCGWLIFASGSRAATIVVDVAYSAFYPENIAINAGDTVTWLWVGGSGDSVQSYGGEFRSPPFNENRLTFSHTFTKPGFVAYTSSKYNQGTIDVRSSASPPAVAINSPIEGYYFPPQAPFFIQVSVTNLESNVSRVEVFAGTNLWGTATNEPYRVTVPGTPWNGAPPIFTNHVLIATVTDKQGTTFTSAPVKITIASGDRIYAPRILPTGQFLAYQSRETSFRSCIGSVTNVEDRPNWIEGRKVPYYGTYIQEGAHTTPRQFFMPINCH